MKIVALNGSPKKNGNTAYALSLVLAELEKEGIETEIIQVGGRKISGCTGCGACARNRDEKCIIDDEANGWIAKMKEADGFILSSPVYYASVNGTVKSFLDRAFYVSGMNGNLFRHKVGASVVAVRRSGGLPAFNELNNYLNYSEMFVPTSNYWNVIHGARPGEAEKDLEGVQIMKVLGLNMAYLLKMQEAAKALFAPEAQRKTYMNFIR